MELYMIRRTSAWADSSELEKTAAESARVGNEDATDRIRALRDGPVWRRCPTTCVPPSRAPCPLVPSC
jgi:hypothetical protein